MTKDGAMICFTVGLLMTIGGVGTIEQDPTTNGLITGLLVAIVGLMVMGCGTLAMKVLEDR